MNINLDLSAAEFWHAFLNTLLNALRVTLSADGIVGKAALIAVIITLIALVCDSVRNAGFADDDDPFKFTEER